MYVITDIETTGLNPRWDRITEISMIAFDGENVTEEFSTLINPERLIPAQITQLTGITTSMVEKAPKFYEIARKIVEFTEGKIIVGHNIQFDYNFLRAEFQHLGYEFTRKTLCTVKLSKKLFPGFRSYGLGNLCKSLNIQVNDRHRAAGDAMATVEVFRKLLMMEGKNGQSFQDVSAIPFKDLNPVLKRQTIENLPESCGVYYLFNEKKELIYVGKSLNIRKRIIEHLRKPNGIRVNDMRQHITDISYELTGSELIALLMESAEIKLHQPLFNRQQRKTLFNTGLYYFFNEAGYCCFTVEKVKSDKNPIALFTSKMSARGYLENLQRQYGLCQKLCGLYPASGACFEYTIQLCRGACCGEEPAENYNERALRAIEKTEGPKENLFIIDKGRTIKERAVVKIEQGRYKGYGYIDLDCFSGSLEELNDCVHFQEDNRDVHFIIRHYLQKNKVEQIIRY